MPGAHVRERRPRHAGALRRVVAAFATTVTAVALGGAAGAWPVGAPASGSSAPARTGTAVPVAQPMVSVLSALATRDIPATVEAERAPREQPRKRDREETTARRTPPPVPAGSGRGRRVVFDMSAQRVWLVRANGSTVRTYRVSGSRHDNLRPGRYAVYSASRHATAYDHRSTMQYFVRFTRGANAAIGFHDIPVDADGKPLQTVRQLGRPLSSGCIRQRRIDARALWRFAPVGTPVVVVR